MKKMLFFSICSIVLFSACQKEHIGFGAQKTSFSSNTDFTSMISLLVEEGLHKGDFEILVFNDMNAFTNALVLIESTGDEIMDTDTTMDFDHYLSAIDSSFNFYSLHQQIEGQLKTLENENALFDENDPDNHFIVSDYLRTFLTPYCEVVIGDILYIFRDGYTIGVSDYDDNAVYAIRGLINTYADESEFYYLCNDNPNIFIVSPDSTTLDVDFSVSCPDTNSFRVNFTNKTGSVIGNLSYLWDFGDGTTSTLPNPSHKYTTGGLKTVTLTASGNGITKSIQRTITAQKGGAYVDFSYTHNPSGKYFFTINGSVYPGDYPSYYEIEFGDYSYTTENSSNTTIIINHQYPYSYSSQSVNIKVSLHTQNGSFVSMQRSLTVSYKKCKKNCSAHTKNNTVFPHYHLCDNYYVKSAVQIVNFGLTHAIYSKSIFLRKNNNKSYTRVKADSLTTGAAGSIYFYSNNTPDDNCGIDTTFNLHKKRSNCKKVNFQNHRGNPFSVDHYSLSSYLIASYQGHDSNLQVGASISK